MSTLTAEEKHTCGFGSAVYGRCRLEEGHSGQHELTPRTKEELLDYAKRMKLAEKMAEFANWQALAASKRWKLPGNSPLSNETWIAYWQACDAYERDPSRGRPVIPHRSGGHG